ncbi:MAG: hypothetical protein JWM11_4926 [Planctomycetaceae bacterium]|nr:hypothetical protein [Planctomycetaceae bacterium]
MPHPKFWSSEILAAARAVMFAIVQDKTGCTVNPRTAKEIKNVDHWAVAYKKYEQRHNMREFNLAAVAGYIWFYREILFPRDEVYVGVWLDEPNGVYYLDISTLHADEAHAIAIAVAEKQDCIVNLLSKIKIWTRRIDRKVA